MMSEKLRRASTTKTLFAVSDATKPVSKTVDSLDASNSVNNNLSTPPTESLKLPNISSVQSLNLKTKTASVPTVGNGTTKDFISGKTKDLMIRQRRLSGKYTFSEKIIKKELQIEESSKVIEESSKVSSDKRSNTFPWIKDKITVNNRRDEIARKYINNWRIRNRNRKAKGYAKKEGVIVEEVQVQKLTMQKTVFSSPEFEKVFNDLLIVED